MQIYSPEQRIELPLFENKKIEVYIKRDDMIHPFISGNKWRKLKYNLQEAKNQHKNTLVTFGGAWSNHLLATAAAGASHGLNTIGYVRGEIVSNPVLSMCEIFGMKIHFIDRTSYKDKYTLFENSEYSEIGYFIDEGGSGNEAVKGCEELISELSQNYDHIVCAAGTGSTVAGIQQGIINHQLSTILHIIPVLKGGDFILDEIRKLNVNIGNASIHLDYHFGGYAKTKPELINFIQNFVSQTGIMVEPTYTGKAMYALHDLIEKDYFTEGSKILFVHTGGLTGLLGMLDKFKSV